MVWPPRAFTTSCILHGTDSTSLLMCLWINAAHSSVRAWPSFLSVVGWTSLLRTALSNAPRQCSMGFISGKYGGQSSWSISSFSMKSCTPLALWGGALSCSEQEITAKVCPYIWHHFCLQNPPVGVAVEVVLQDDQIATTSMMNCTQSMDWTTTVSNSSKAQSSWNLSPTILLTRTLPSARWSRNLDSPENNAYRKWRSCRFWWRLAHSRRRILRPMFRRGFLAGRLALRPWLSCLLFTVPLETLVFMTCCHRSQVRRWPCLVLAAQSL